MVSDPICNGEDMPQSTPEFTPKRLLHLDILFVIVVDTNTRLISNSLEPHNDFYVVTAITGSATILQYSRIWQK